MLTRTTTWLLNDLRDPGNQVAWEQFDRRYRPVLAALARRLGLNPDEGEELAQQALAEFVRAYWAGRYERGQGRLSSWLLGIARNLGLSMRRQKATSPAEAASAIAEVPDEAELSRAWDEERERTILLDAMGELRNSSQISESTWTAFELVALRGLPAQQVATRCGLTLDAVYLAKSRITRRLRELVAEMTAAYDEDE